MTQPYADTKYSITYDDNVVSNMPVDSSDKTHSSTIPLPNITPKRTGYKFLGWCNSIPTTTNGTDSCTGTIYNPNGDGTNLTYTLDQTGGPNALSLTAMWKELDTMQGFAAGNADTTCAEMSIGDTLKLKDSRDNTEYEIGKLKDGKCWMIENLNLAGGTALSAENTDVDATYINSFTTSNNLTKDGNTIKLPASDTAGFDQNNYSFVYNSGNTTDCGASGQNTPCYSYYSWDATTLGSGRTIAAENTDAEQSICPKGWRLPTSGADSNNGWKRGNFYALAKAYGANLESDYYDYSSATGANFYNNAGPGTTPNFLLAGYYYDGSFGSGGRYGNYWSSTSYSSTNLTRYLYFDSSSVYSAGYYFRYGGFSVRCILKAE